MITTRTSQGHPSTLDERLLSDPRTVENGLLVVVGIDGSGGGRNAARWAAAEATRRHARLRLVHAYSRPVVGYSGYNPFPATLIPDLRDEGQGMLEELGAMLRRENPSLEISTQLSAGDPASVLHNASQHAVLTVVGANGASRAAVALGSVAGAVAAANPAPVAVIHPGPARTDGPVVVGSDGAPTSEAAIAFAFEAAAQRAAALVAVQCWTDRAVGGPGPGSLAVVADPGRIDGGERILLAERLSGWAERYPDVVVEQTVVHDRPAAALLRLASTAQLMVIGSRGHRGIAGVLLGSTGQRLIAHGPCPVVIVRPGGSR